MEMWMCILWGFVCAFLNRVRGGMFGKYLKSLIPFWGTTICRITTSGLMVFPCWWFFSADRCLFAWLALYVGFIFGWKAWQAMTNLPKDIFSMGLRGLLLTVPVGIILDNLSLTLCGAFMGVFYALGLVFPIIKEPDGTDSNNVTNGEFMFGCLLGLCISHGCN